MLDLLRHRELLFDVTFKRIVVATQDIYGPTSTAFINDVKSACEGITVEIIDGLPEWNHLKFSRDDGHSLLILGRNYSHSTCI